MSIFRLCVSSHMVPKTSSASHVNKLLSVSRHTAQLEQKAGIKSQKFREPVKKPKPFPYTEKRFYWYHDIFDDVLSRFDENTKVIVVEGNIASGKSALVKTLADELGMKYFKEPSVNDFYVDDYGFDLRTIDHLVPESLRSCDMKRYYENPHDRNVAAMQLLMYKLRFEQYLDALVHLLNTGDGVILERSPYSDFVFAETMCKFGYMSKPALKVYHEIRANTLSELLRPHLVIYLDCPSDILLKRIKERNIPYEVKSKVLTKDYLDEIDNQYKHTYLRSVREHTELLLYDWSSFGDPELVVDNIEHINFEAYEEDNYTPMLMDWRKVDVDWAAYRLELTSNKHTIMCYFDIPMFDAPELIIPGEDLKEYERVLESFDDKRQVYQKGYNRHLGDKFNLFKMTQDYWRTLKQTNYFPRV